MSETGKFAEIKNYLTAIGIDNDSANTIAGELIMASNNNTRPLFWQPGKGKTLTPELARNLGMQLIRE